MKGIMDTIPGAVVMGNHEDYSLDWKMAKPDRYLAHFHLPNNGDADYKGYFYIIKKLYIKNMEVMNLATDAILKVKDAELKAKEILEKANKDVLILKEEAKEKVKKSYDEAIKNAKKEAEELKLKYKNEGEAIAMPIFESAERKVSSIKDIGEDKLKSVVDMIVERIVNSNGNS